MEGREVVGAGGDRERRIKEQIRRGANRGTGNKCEFNAMFYSVRGASMLIRFIEYKLIG